MMGRHLMILADGQKYQFYREVRCQQCHHLYRFPSDQG
jgi:hypothetical protein